MKGHARGARSTSMVKRPRGRGNARLLSPEAAPGGRRVRPSSHRSRRDPPKDRRALLAQPGSRDGPLPCGAASSAGVPPGRSAPVRQNIAPGGPYELTVSALGYGEVQRDGIHLSADQRLQLDLTLTRAAIAMESLEVSLERRFDISRAGPAITIDQRVIQTHPTIERSFMELGALSPVAVETSEEGGRHPRRGPRRGHGRPPERAEPGEQQVGSGGK